MAEEGFGEFEDYLEERRPGERHLLLPLLACRKGGDAAAWAVPGGYRYVPRNWTACVGASRWSGGAATSGVLEVALPVKYADYPLVWVTVQGTTPLFKDVRCQVPLASPGALEIWWFAEEALTQVTFNWLAIGPLGV